MLTHHPVDGWRVRATAGPVPPHLDGLEVAATVPGTAHTDLLDAGLIDDPYVDDGEVALAWMHRDALALPHEVALPTPAARRAGRPRVRRARHGGDRSALGGVVVGARRTCTARTGSTCASRPSGRPGRRCADVDLASALEHAEAEQARIGVRPGAYPHPLNMVRKMACSFGWDWGPDLQTAGLWQPVTGSSAGGWPGSPRCARWSPCRATARRPTVAVHVDVERSGIGSPAAELAGWCALGEHGGAGRVAAGASAAVVEVAVEDQPACGGRVGYGEATAARPRGDAGRRAATPLDTWARRIGLRTVARRHHARRARHALHVRRQRPAALRQGRQLDPRRPPAHPGHPRPARPPASTRRSAPG